MWKYGYFLFQAMERPMEQVMQYLLEVEMIAEDVLTIKQQIIDLDRDKKQEKPFSKQSLVL